MASNTPQGISPLVNLSKYGPRNMGSGDVDCTDAWDEAHDAAKNGDTIFIPSGVFAFDSLPTWVPKQLHYAGAGASNSIMYATGNGPVLLLGSEITAAGPWVDRSTNTWLANFYQDASVDFRPKDVTDMTNMQQEDTPVPLPYDSSGTLSLTTVIASAGLVTAGVRAGDNVKVTADIAEHNDGSGNPYRYGRYFTVLGVDGDDIYFTNTIPYLFWAGAGGTFPVDRALPTAGAGGGVDNVRAAIVPRFSPRVTDLGFRSDSGTGSLVIFNGCTRPVFSDCAVHASNGAGVQFISCVDGLAKNSSFNNCLNDPDNGSLGWAVTTTSTKSMKVVDCAARYCRGAFSATAVSNSADNASLSLYGGCEDFRVMNFAATASAVVSFDSGPLCSGSFLGCSSQDDYVGDRSGEGGGSNTGAVGFQIRGRRVTLRDCVVHNSRVAYLITGAVARQAGAITLFNCEAHASPHRAIHVTTQAAGAVDNLRIIGGFYETDGWEEVCSFNGAEVFASGGATFVQRNGCPQSNDRVFYVNGGSFTFMGIIAQIMFNDSDTGNAGSIVGPAGICFGVADRCFIFAAENGAVIQGNDIYGDWSHNNDPEFSHFFAGDLGTGAAPIFQVDGIRMSPRSHDGAIGISIRADDTNAPSAAPTCKFGYWDAEEPILANTRKLF